MMNYKKLWIKLINFFTKSNQTNWGKLQLLELIKTMELEEARKETTEEDL